MLNDGQEILSYYEKIRFPNDQRFSNFKEDFLNENKLNNFLLQNTLQISKISTPHLFECTSKVLENLKLKSAYDINFFVYASEEIQAQCYAFSKNKCFIKFSSSLVNLLEEDEFCFVIGHELGHFILGHHNYSYHKSHNDFNSLMSSRAKEISVDRIGLIASQEINSSLSALIKCVSGLDSKHLKINISEFLTQLKDINLGIESDSIYLSHPPMLVRCRSLLWFSMLNNYKNIGEINSNELDVLNKKVINDMEKYIDAPIIKIKNEMSDNLMLWLFGKKIVSSGKFSKNNQKIFIELFGEVKLKKFTNFISLFTKKDILHEIEKKVTESLHVLKLNFPENYDQIYESLNNKVNTRFNEN
tara:strand:- start:191 stop:1267 length:1077 start_codon:yes stop_codon:yes gene_type:complete